MPSFFSVIALAVIALAETPWSPGEVLTPADLAGNLKNEHQVLHVGPAHLYRGKHIPGSQYAGFAATSEGQEKLKELAGHLDKTKTVVLYCGCCPWDHCPNIRPAYQLLKERGFRKVEVLMIPTNFAADWTGKGYPVEAGH